MNLKNQSFIHIIFSIAFFISGLCINMVQFVLYFTVALKDMQIFRRFNYYLTYSMWSQVVALATWWADIELNVYYDEKNPPKQFGSDYPMLVLMNHTFEIDWIISWLICDHYKKLGSAKSFTKKSLRWIPIIGWSWIFGEFAFLERSLEKDSSNIVNTLKKFLEYESPVLLLFFAEGTRFTKEKHENSVKFAKERGLPILKHHLLPRPRGFNLCVRTFKEEMMKNPKHNVMLAQLELRFPKGQRPPSLMSLVRGEKLKADVYARIRPVKDIPSDSEKETNDFLYNLYKEQDDLVDFYEENGYFPGNKTLITPRKKTLFNWVAWITFTCFLLPYYLFPILINSSWFVISITLSIITLALITSHIMINQTKIQKSSSYGMENGRKQK